MLSDTGRQQAAVAAAELARRGLRRPAVVSGRPNRQRDTAHVVAEHLRVDEVAVDGRFDEYDFLGLIAEQADRPGGSAPSSPPPGGDDISAPARNPARAFQRDLDVALRAWIVADAPDGWRAFAEGAVAAVQELAGQVDAGRDAVVATSGGVIAAVCGHLLGTGPAGVVALNRVTVNAGITTLLVGRSGINLLAFNDHAHFAGRQAALRTYR